MAQFEVTFDRNTRGPEYDKYDKSIDTVCFDDASPKTLAYDSPADYILGYNYTGPNVAETITILSFTDETTAFEPGISITHPVTTNPNILLHESTGLPLTYPHTVSVADVHNIQEKLNDVELKCYEDGSSKYENKRERIITYYITDVGGLDGPTRTSKIINVDA